MDKGTSMVAKLAIQNEDNPAQIEAIKAMGITSYLGIE